MLPLMVEEYIDVVIVGAGLSGIGTAWHLQDKCPDRRYLILEEVESLPVELGKVYRSLTRS